MKRALIALLRAYKQWLSPLLPPSCRYVPTCSEYAMEAIERHGAWLGCRLAFGRLLRCHPWGGRGFDPVPQGDDIRLTSHWGGCCGRKAGSLR